MRVEDINVVDIEENRQHLTKKLLNILLVDRTMGKNIIWATDSYQIHGKRFAPERQITSALVTGRFGGLIQPRAVKSLHEQVRRTKYNAEVFTPLKSVDLINRAVERQTIDKNNWQEYVTGLMLEIACGEAPFIASRYNPTSHTGKLIKLSDRVGFLDRKLKVVSRYCVKREDWLVWAGEAFKASYGYDWQGDNVLIARKNLLYTFIDFYEDKFKHKPTLSVMEEIAEIISWNIFQMDGLKCVVPMSCKSGTKRGNDLFGWITETEYQCEGCKYKQVDKHNGKYVRIMDWAENRVVKFVELIS